MGIRNGKQILEQVGESVSHWKNDAKEVGIKEGHSRIIHDNLFLLTPKTMAVTDIKE